MTAPLSSLVVVIGRIARVVAVALLSYADAILMDHCGRERDTSGENNYITVLYSNCHSYVPSVCNYSLGSR